MTHSRSVNVSTSSVNFFCAAHETQYRDADSYKVSLSPAHRSHADKLLLEVRRWSLSDKDLLVNAFLNFSGYLILARHALTFLLSPHFFTIFEVASIHSRGGRSLLKSEFFLLLAEKYFSQTAHKVQRFVGGFRQCALLRKQLRSTPSAFGVWHKINFCNCVAANKQVSMPNLANLTYI